MIEDSSFCFKETHEATTTIYKALGQVIHITGDLHGGRFHFLSAIYSLFYGSLFQFMQILLSWKRIPDVTKCYQQAAGLVLMICNKFDKKLMAYFLHIMQEEDGEQRATLEACIDDSREFALIVASMFIKWMEKKQQESTDDIFKMIINFVILVEFYRKFCPAFSTGDSVMIECLYREFHPIYFPSKKKHYIEIVMTMMETLYAKIGHR